MLIFQAGADLHAGNDQKGSDTTDAADKDYSREELDESSKSKISKKEESKTCMVDSSATKYEAQLFSSLTSQYRR